MNHIALRSIIMVLVFVSIIQYPYYLFERYDGSITIYQYDYYGQLIPLYNFVNLQHMVQSLYQPWGYGVPMY
jgi:hypothetical protein